MYNRRIEGREIKGLQIHVMYQNSQNKKHTESNQKPTGIQLENKTQTKQDQNGSLAVFSGTEKPFSERSYRVDLNKYSQTQTN